MPAGSDERPAPSAIGTLESRPLVHLLVYARNRRLSGRLEVRAPDGRDGTINLWRGRIKDARTVPPVMYFGALAYELGLIDTATLDATLLEIATSKRLHGEVLVERGALTTVQRDAVLSEQICRKVHHLFSLPPETTFAFYDMTPSVEEPPFTLDPIKPAWRGLKECPPTESLIEVLARFASATLRMANEGPIAQAGFDPDELALCEALTWKPMTIAQMRFSASASLPGARVELLAYLLIITKCAEPATTSSPSLPAVNVRSPSGSMPVANARPPSGSLPSVNMGASSGSMPVAAAVPPPPSSQRIPPPPPSSQRILPTMPRTVSTPGTPAVATSPPGEPRHSLSFKVPTGPSFRSAGNPSSQKIAIEPSPVFSPADVGAMGIEHRASIIATEDPFTVLGITEGSSPEAARASYFRLAKLWHPDRLPEDLAPFRAEVDKIFEAMTRAYRTLTDPEERKEFLATGKVAGSSPPPSIDKPRRDVIRDIDTALGKREFKAAEALSRQLARADGDDSEAQALVAWASALAGEASEETLRATVPLLDKAVNNDRDCERAVYYRGIVHKRLGNSAGAFRDFARVAQMNPKHVDAQRELRIFEMRARKGGSGEHALDALIAKTKKK